MPVDELYARRCKPAALLASGAAPSDAGSVESRRGKPSSTGRVCLLSLTGSGGSGCAARSPTFVRNRCRRDTDCGHEFCNDDSRILPGEGSGWIEVSANLRLGESDPPRDPGRFSVAGSTRRLNRRSVSRPTGRSLPRARGLRFALRVGQSPPISIEPKLTRGVIRLLRVIRAMQLTVRSPQTQALGLVSQHHQTQRLEKAGVRKESVTGQDVTFACNRPQRLPRLAHRPPTILRRLNG